jgi:hypothetical protein
VHLALIKYSVLRLALFVGSLMLLYAVGVRQSILMLVLAAVISLALSYVLLAKQREAVAQALSERISGRLDRRSPGQADADAEDADVAELERSEQAERARRASERQADGQ